MLVLVLVLAAAMVPARGAVPTVKTPDTPAGRALAELVESSHAAGEMQRKWVEPRTAVTEEPRANIQKMEAEFLQQYGRITVVRIVNSSPASVVAIVRQATSGAHGHLTMNVEPAVPHKVVYLGMRAATPAEINRGAGQ